MSAGEGPGCCWRYGWIVAVTAGLVGFSSQKLRVFGFFVTKYSVFEDVQCSLPVTCLQEAELLSGKLKILKRSQYHQKLCLVSLVYCVEDLHYVNTGCLGMVSTVMHTVFLPVADSKPCRTKSSSPALCSLDTWEVWKLRTVVTNLVYLNKLDIPFFFSFFFWGSFECLWHGICSEYCSSVELSPAFLQQWWPQGCTPSLSPLVCGSKGCAFSRCC